MDKKPDDFIDKLNTFVGNESVKLVLAGITKYLNEKAANDSLAFDKRIVITKWRIWQESIILLLVLITITVLALNDVIDKCSVGTLMGIIIGYSLSRLKKENLTQNKR